MKNWYVYMLRCADGSLYTGVTTDLTRREQEHNTNDKLGARYTRGRRPVVMVWCEPHPDRASASRREVALKRLRRSQKEHLIKTPVING
ncbi:GIY-YIG nuclease family protein [Nitrincola alkalilacustris]|uniref:GIY-YIG nuclease family protein n=1 Tax=Nitrincola alkalilacustris TaxID=1571224 RepID=UPI00124D7639|nr:GIY-YIG nuclease family protein [Nitrincola alkalilacustris]